MSARLATEARRPVVPIGPYVREQLLARVRSALRIAEGDLGANFEQFRSTLAEAVERADAVELTATADCEELEELLRPSSRLSYAALAQVSAAAGEPAREFLLIPFGQVEVDCPIAGEAFAFTQGHAESAQRWFQQIGRKLAIDYEHQSFDRLNTRADGLRPAAGWIGGLELRDDGLWAVEVTWTEKAAELLRSGEYRYFSPVIFWTDESRSDVAALGPVALTNDPAMRGVPALAARTALGLDALNSQAPDLLASARSEIDTLQSQLAERDADAFVDRGLTAGKIVASTRDDWREDYLRDPSTAHERLARAPVALPPGRVVTARGVDPAARGPRHAVASAARDKTVEMEDLAAFERAVSAGRVLRSSPQT